MNPAKLAEVVAIHERAHEIPSGLVNSALVTS